MKRDKKESKKNGKKFPLNKCLEEGDEVFNLDEKGERGVIKKKKKAVCPLEIGPPPSTRAGGQTTNGTRECALLSMCGPCTPSSVFRSLYGLRRVQ